MSAVFYNDVLPWSPFPEDTRRLRRSMTVMLAAMLVISAAVHLIRMPDRVIDRAPEVPPRFAQLIVQKKPLPPPPHPVQREETPPLPETKPEPKPEAKKAEPRPEPVRKEKPAPAEQARAAEPGSKPDARERASRTGLLALSQELSGLRSESAAADMQRRQIRQDAPAAAAPRTERAIITSSSGKTSGGIDTARLSRDAGNTQLAGRETTRVDAPADDMARLAGGSTQGQGRGAASNGPAQRGSEDIQMIFDRNKGALNSIYNRALRANPNLTGKLVLKLTIDPDGKVTACELISSQLGDAELERRLIARVQMFDFGAKPVATTTITYPIDFFPG